MKSQRFLLFLFLSLLLKSASTQTVTTLISPNEESADCFGFSVSAAGDVNNDGCQDVIVGAKGETNPETRGGRAYIFSGSDGSVLHVLDTPMEPGYPSFGWFAYSVADAGDVNIDGYDDVVIGARMESGGGDTPHSGRAYVFDGSNGDLLYALVSPFEEMYGYFGHIVSGAGDMNDDGHQDIMVGAPL